MIFSSGKRLQYVYISMSVGMQGKLLMVAFEDDRKYFELLGVSCGGV